MINTSVDEKTFQLLGSAKKLREITLEGDTITDHCLHSLGNLTDLASIYLESTPLVTASGLKFLPALPQLWELYLKDLNLDDSVTEILEKCGGLKTLVLESCDITDVGVERLSRLEKLDCLSLDGTLVSGEFLANSGFENLRHLSLNSCPIERANLVSNLNRLSELDTLGLSYTPVGDDWLQSIAELPKLYDLRLEGTNISDTGVSFLHGHPRLTLLYLRETSVSEDAISKLKESSKCELYVYTN
ncbi:hypothetical protein [Thalassoglobus neptunius]|nr:hypothetical protein [Thalassoglobus neptunius]